MYKVVKQYLPKKNFTSFCAPSHRKAAFEVQECLCTDFIIYLKSEVVKVSFITYQCVIKIMCLGVYQLSNQDILIQKTTNHFNL